MSSWNCAGEEFRDVEGQGVLIPGFTTNGKPARSGILNGGDTMDDVVRCDG